MAALCKSSVESLATASCPSVSHSDADQVQAKPFSAKSAEFVPKQLFTAKSKEFVPSWKRAQEAVAPVNSEESHSIGKLAVPTDDSSEKQDKEVAETVTASEGLKSKPFSSKAKEFVPKALSAKSAEFVPKWLSASSAEFVPKSVSAKPEHVTATPAFSQQNCNAISFGAYGDSSDEETEDQSQESSTDEGKHDALKTNKLSSSTLSTCIGSPTAGLSTDEGAASTGSETGTSRSHSPAPPILESSPISFGVNALLQWRHSAPSKRPVDLLLVAEEVKPVIVEAGAAAVEAKPEVCAEMSSVKEPALSDFFSKKSGLKKKKQAAATSKEVEELPVEEVALPAEVPLEEVALPVEEMPVAEKTPKSSPPKDMSSPLKQTVSLSPQSRRTEEVALVAPLEQEKPRHAEEKSWRNVETVKKLEVSEESWAAKQRARRSAQSGTDSDNVSDKDVVRAMKSILNKLTVEKFDSLSSQLMQCGIRSATHLEQLIEEIFEKATTQHHFIDMYADLCSLLNKHRIIEDTSINFKKILLTCCQVSFEKNLTPPTGLSELSSEDRNASEFIYKMRMIGNIRFVGALLVRKMLASKVMLSIMEVLLQDPTPEALESLAAFLMVVGPSFDTVDWAYRASLNAVFAQIGQLSKKESVPSRVKCLLKDVVDVRNLGWLDRRPKKIEGPLKLDQVAKKAAVELGGGQWDASKQSSNGDNWEVVSGSRKAPSIFQMSAPPVSQQAAKISKNVDLFKKARDKEEASKKEESFKKEEAAKKEAKKEKKEKKEAKREAAAQFDKEAWRVELSATLAELRLSHEVRDAIARIGDAGLPVAQQPSELCEILSRITEEGSEEVRKLGFGLVAGLFLEKHWMPESAAQGIRSFVEDICPDLKFDVPALPQILRDELYPALAPLAKANLLDIEQHDCLKSVC